MIQKGTPILIPSETLIEYISQEDIAFRYIPGFKKVGESFRARKEKNPSAMVEWGMYGYLMFVDYGDIKYSTPVSIIKYIQQEYNIPTYQATINKIAQDFGLIKGLNSFSIVNSKKQKVKRGTNKFPSNLTIRIKKRPYSVYDEDYWGQYCIPITMLERNNIHSISHVWYNNNPPIRFVDDYCVYSYDYYWHNNKFRRKIYAPNDENNKWYTNTDYSIVQNQPNIPKSGDLLFIQSSYKDCMSMELLGYWAVAPNKEGSWFTEQYWNKLKERWKQIIIMWDNDHFKPENSGILMAQHYSEKYNVPYITTPSVDKITDISEFNRDYGLSSGKDLIRDLLKNI